MSVREQIFETFFEKLLQSDDISESTLSKLKALRNDEKLWSKDIILEIVTEGGQNVDENQEH